MVNTTSADKILRAFQSKEKHRGPCICPRCIYQTYLASCSAEGRRISRLTAFVFFVRAAAFEKALYSVSRNWMITYRSHPRPENDPLLLKAKDRRWELAEKRGLPKRPEKWPPYLVTDLFIEEVREETRRISLEALRELLKSQKNPKVRALLKPLSRAKALYEYWRRAGDSKIAEAFQAAEKNILDN